jgi:hypothetical protein
MEALLEKQTVAGVLADARQLRQEAEVFLQAQGVKYQLDDWLTIKRYCEKFNIKDIQIVTNWINRGVVPPENIKVFDELNGLKLIKAVPYK